MSIRFSRRQILEGPTAGEELGQETEYTVQRAWGVLFRKKVLKTERDREREGEGETEREEEEREKRGKRETESCFF